MIIIFYSSYFGTQGVASLLLGYGGPQDVPGKYEAQFKTISGGLTSIIKI